MKMRISEESAMNKVALLSAFLRQDLSTFVEKVFSTLEPGTHYCDNWHIHAMTHALMCVARGENQRLIINVPPRSMKSITVTIAFTAWLLGHHPEKRILTVSYSSDLSQAHAAGFRAVVTSDWFRRAFPGFEIAVDRRDEIITSKRGYRFAGSIGGSILGRGADVILIDDPIKGLLAALSAAERRRVAEFYNGTLYSRLNDKLKGAIVIVMQRLHQDDLVGHVLEKEVWEQLIIPAVGEEEQTYALGGGRLHRRLRGEVLHPEREPLEILEIARRNLGTMNFSAQYQQNPLPASGNIIKREWLRYYQERCEHYERTIASWDTASTIQESADWSVGTVWGVKGDEFHLIDVVRGRWEVPELRRRILDLSAHYSVDATLIEDTELGRAVAQDLRHTGNLRPLLRTARFDKQARLLAQTARFEAGQVVIPLEASWLTAYLEELLAFPAGRHDDQVDSTSQALRYLTAHTPVVRERPTSVNRPAFLRRPPSAGSRV
jgi:predicted phage terminase large subunit-like protein